jgi:hypothetical protein
MIVQYPASDGQVFDYVSGLIETAHELEFSCGSFLIYWHLL